MVEGLGELQTNKHAWEKEKNVIKEEKETSVVPKK